jgi:octanoyl-[GcvH]:protein N-octanoyltransferase
MHAFGGPVRLCASDAEDLKSSASASEDMARVHHVLSTLNGSGPGSLRIYRPQPTAAFAPRDTTLPAYDAATDAMRKLGYMPVERRAGGQLAIYDSHALVIDLVAPHEEPRQHVIERFRAFSAAVADALRCFSIDARIGQVAGEYCPGDYSVNAGGAVKLAGIAQRIGRRGYHLGAVISVQPSPDALQAVAVAYGILRFPFAPETFGAAMTMSAKLSFPGLVTALLDGFKGLVDMEKG